MNGLSGVLVGMVNLVCCRLFGHDWHGVTWVDGGGNHGPVYCARCNARGEPVSHRQVARGGPYLYFRDYDTECQRYGFWDANLDHFSGCPRDHRS